jgi:hypothetical protein
MAAQCRRHGLRNSASASRATYVALRHLKQQLPLRSTCYSHNLCLPRIIRWLEEHITSSLASSSSFEGPVTRCLDAMAAARHALMAIISEMPVSFQGFSLELLEDIFGPEPNCDARAGESGSAGGHKEREVASACHGITSREGVRGGAWSAVIVHLDQKVQEAHQRSAAARETVESHVKMGLEQRGGRQTPESKDVDAEQMCSERRCSDDEVATVVEEAKCEVLQTCGPVSRLLQPGGARMTDLSIANDFQLSCFHREVRLA